MDKSSIYAKFKELLIHNTNINFEIKNMAIKDLGIDKSWTLFLDRDGVVNHKLPDDYVKKIEEFQFLPFSEEAIAELNQIFGFTILVTNQQGIGKGLMKVEDLCSVHDFMVQGIKKAGGKIDRIFFCPDLASENTHNRKPEIGMALQAKKEFPQIDFNKSLMVGDSLSDMQFGRKAGMRTVLVSGGRSRLSDEFIKNADFIVSDLKELSNRLKK